MHMKPQLVIFYCTKVPFINISKQKMYSLYNGIFVTGIDQIKVK